jgi:cytochrome b subunit of formate dehydrogenase
MHARGIPLPVPRAPAHPAGCALRLAGLCFTLLVFRLCPAAEPGVAEPAAPAANSNASCLECHSDSELSMRKEGRKLSLFVDEGVLAGSVHRTLDCIDCHEDFDGDATPHRKPMVSVDCISCHEDTGKKHLFHPRLMLAEIPRADDTSCTTCHGTHAVAAVKSAASPFASALQPQACGKCHEQARDLFTTSAHGHGLAAGQPNAPDCLTCHKKDVVPLAGAKPTLEQKMTQTAQCESCHVGKDTVVGQALRGRKFVLSFEQSVHGAGLTAGNSEAANCVDCHGAHEMNRAMLSGARMHKLNVADTCARCHEGIAADFNDSVHAAALRKGNVESAVCTDCHGEHEIRKHTDPLSPVHKKNVAQQVCADCHASLKLTRKYGIASHTFQTFADSYHGLAVRGGSVSVVNCASCHTSHAIKSQQDPASSVHKANLVQTCGQCHPGANTRFTVGKVHISPSAGTGVDGNHPILFFIANIYVLLIVGVVGGMFLHNLLDFVKKIRRKLAIQKGLIEDEHVAHRLYLRMTVNERLQHGVLVISFVLLVVTGFMLRYPEAWWVVAIRNVSSDAFEWRSLIHRIAGVVMVAGGFWHMWYLAFTTRGRELFFALLPKWRDVTDPWHVLKYNVGLVPVKPRFGRFSYIEKAEYWALVWGTVLMGVTGFVLWFENTSMGLFTKLGYDISRTIHFYEAILATLAIIVWHFYFVIFNPDVYPMNLAWLTGRMSEKEMLEEHPLELERLKAGEAPKAVPPKLTVASSEDRTPH